MRQHLIWVQDNDIEEELTEDTIVLYREPEGGQGTEIFRR